jgi:hypothetical protein
LSATHILLIALRILDFYRNVRGLCFEDQAVLCRIKNHVLRECVCPNYRYVEQRVHIVGRAPIVHQEVFRDYHCVAIGLFMIGIWRDDGKPAGMIGDHARLALPLFWPHAPLWSPLVPLPVEAGFWF